MGPTLSVFQLVKVCIFLFIIVNDINYMYFATFFICMAKRWHWKHNDKCVRQRFLLACLGIKVFYFDFTNIVISVIFWSHSIMLPLVLVLSINLLKFLCSIISALFNTNIDVCLIRMKENRNYNFWNTVKFAREIGTLNLNIIDIWVSPVFVIRRAF